MSLSWSIRRPVRAVLDERNECLPHLLRDLDPCAIQVCSVDGPELLLLGVTLASVLLAHPDLDDHLDNLCRVIRPPKLRVRPMLLKSERRFRILKVEPPYIVYEVDRLLPEWRLVRVSIANCPGCWIRISPGQKQAREPTTALEFFGVR